VTATTIAHRVYFAAVGLFALWVGIWGYVFPAEVGRALPWPVPPLHARFIGSMYLSGTVLMAGALLARSLAEVRIALVMATLWTGMLGLVSLLHLDAFDFAHRPVWFWFFAYIAYPILGALLALRYRAPRPGGDFPLPMPVRIAFGVVAAACLALAVTLFFAPDAMTGAWPWKITPLLAQIYAGPFLSYGVGSLMIALSRGRAGTRLPMLAMAAFAILVLVASLIHSGLFDPRSTSAILWFGGFAAAIVATLASATLGWRREATP